jgi:hypothetical protein
MFDLSVFAEHHRVAIQRGIAHFQADSEILALLLVGSLAHGFARASSDVDVMFVVSHQDYQQRRASSRLNFYDPALCDYPGGYVDGKYVDLAFIQEVASRGSEPARFAFKDARILYSSIPDLQIHLDAAAQYSLEGHPHKIAQFYAQLEAWNWFALEALKADNRYLLQTACSKMALFGCRLILAHNQTLFPFHKWMRRVLAGVPQQPADFDLHLDALLATPTLETVAAFFEGVRTFQPWPQHPQGWSTQFALDSELGWQTGNVAVDDV